MRSRLAFKLLPGHMIEIAVRGNGPLPSSVSPVPVMVGVNCRDGSHAFRRSEFAGPRESLSARGLHAHLHHAMRTFHGPAHAPRMVGIKSHGLLLVDVLACLDGGNEIESMLMLRSGNQHRI